MIELSNDLKYIIAATSNQLQVTKSIWMGNKMMMSLDSMKRNVQWDGSNYREHLLYWAFDGAALNRFKSPK